VTNGPRVQTKHCTKTIQIRYFECCNYITTWEYNHKGSQQLEEFKVSAVIKITGQSLRNKDLKLNNINIKINVSATRCHIHTQHNIIFQIILQVTHARPRKTMHKYTQRERRNMEIA
jgi:hypothetical protein